MHCMQKWLSHMSQYTGQVHNLHLFLQHMSYLLCLLLLYFDKGCAQSKTTNKLSKNLFRRLRLQSHLEHFLFALLAKLLIFT